MQDVKTWYVIMDGGRARILNREGHGPFETKEQLVSPSTPNPTPSLTAERLPRTRPTSTGRHPAVSRHDLHQADKRAFADQIAVILNEANSRNAFDQLMLAAPAKSLGDLSHSLNAATKRKVVVQLSKDLTDVPNAALAEHFNGSAFGRDRSVQS